MSSGSYPQSAVAQKLQYYSTIERREDLRKMILLANPDTIAWALEILDGRYSSGKKSSKRRKRRKQSEQTHTRNQRQNTNRQILCDRSYSADADYLSNDEEPMRSDLSRGFAYGNFVNAMDMAIQRVLDRRLKSDVRVTSQPPDIRKYYIKVTTGDRSGAGTRADVYVVLQGKKRRSDEIFLTDTLSGLRPFQRGQVDKFMIKTENVGQLTELGIGHDQEEKDFSWYLKSVEINSGSKSWHIPCDQWMSGSLESRTTFRFLKVVNLTPDSTRSHRHHRSQGSFSPTTHASKSSRIGSKSLAKPGKLTVRVYSSDSFRHPVAPGARVPMAHKDLLRRIKDLERGNVDFYDSTGSEISSDSVKNQTEEIELSKCQKADCLKLRREHEESVRQSEASLSTLKKKHADMLNEMTDQIENLSGVKSRIDKERTQLRVEVDDLFGQLEEVTKLKSLAESNSKSLENIVTDSKLRIEEHICTIDKLKIENHKLANENMDLAHQLEETENKSKQSQATHHDLDRMREQVEREQEGKSELQHALSKANAEVASWRTKYETDVVQRTEELEEAKKKLVIRLQKAEEEKEKALAKCESVEKTKINPTDDMEDLTITRERGRISLLEHELKQDRGARTKVERDRDELQHGAAFAQIKFNRHQEPDNPKLRLDTLDQKIIPQELF